MDFPLRFDFIPYPLWRRRGLTALSPLLRPFTAAGEDSRPPASPARMAHYLTRWNILPEGLNAAAARDAIAVIRPVMAEAPPASAPVSFTGPIRLPAQWEPLEAVLLTWPALYPPLWHAHAQMAEAISHVARVDILVTDPLWAAAVAVWLERRGRAALERVRFVQMPLDDIWVRDYGPFVGFQADGARAAIDAAYHPDSAYPAQSDDAAPLRYAGLLGVPARPLDLRTEGGNYWSDGQGTLLMTTGLFARNPHLAREEVLRRLHEAFLIDKLLLVEPVRGESTGHVDLVLKLADARTILLSRPSLNGDRTNRTRKLLARETNAAGEPYRIIELPAPGPYLNWGAFPIWRSYTNSLTVNGRVLVPVFHAAQDQAALAIYQSAMPDYEIIPIACAQTANGGGAVHCLTKEIVRER